MFEVILYNDNDVFLATRFHDKNLAIRYFNMKCVQLDSYMFEPYFNRIEILNDSLVLFDYEV